MTFKTESLSDLVKSKTNFRHINTGWDVGKCQCCNDYKERAGFKFTGSAFMYNCWNCNRVGSYDGSSSSISKKTREILNAYGISNEEIDKSLGGAFFTKTVDSDTISLEKIKSTIYFQETSLPEKAVRLGFVESDLNYQFDLLN